MSRKTAAWIVAVVCIAVALVLAIWGTGNGKDHDGGDKRTDFYSSPGSVPSEPGELLRSEPMSAADVPEGARGWRILYTTSWGNGQAAVASGVVVVPASSSTVPAPVVAWAHGTTGVADECAPSRLPDGLAAGGLSMEAEAVGRGWAIVATDYVGLGTAGTHPYVVGQPEARSVLDSIRAARQLDPGGLAASTVIWGYSQGGGAALWADALVPSYMPDLDVVGIAALAPASNLPKILGDLPVVPTSALYLSYVLAAYTSTYPDVTYSEVVRPDAEKTLKQLATTCLDDPLAIQMVDESGILDGPVWVGSPTEGALHDRLVENVPRGPIGAPVLLLQGEADPLVTRASQDQYVKEQCAAGTSIDYRRYDGVNHAGIVQPDDPPVRDLLRWTAARFAGNPASDTCRD